MNKTNRSPKLALALIALAAGGAALAQSNVTIYGVMDAGVFAKQLSGQERVRGLENGIMETSYLGFNGSEDLGGGLRANFDLTTFVRLDSGSSTRGIPGEGFWSRSAWVGVSGGFGSVRLGRISTMNFVNMLRFNPFGVSSVVGPSFLHTYVGSAAQPMTTGSGSTDSAWNNSVAYALPKFAGISVDLQAAAAEGPTDGRRVAASASYGGRPFAVMLSVDRTSSASITFPQSLTNLPGALPPFTGTDFQTAQLGTYYDFGVVKLYGQLSQTDIKGTRPGPPGEKTIKLRTVQLGVSAPIGMGQLLLSAANTDKTQTLVADQKRLTVTLGYDYFLSKRTDIYAVAMSDKVTDLSRGTSFGAGVRHRF